MAYLSRTTSIVITTYNHAQYLKEAINSVLQQTVSPDEIIVVDDGSTDHPETITDSLPGVTLIRQENQGLSAARNTGMAHSSGEFLIFLDADDRLKPQAVESGVKRLVAEPELAMVYGAYELFGTDPDWHQQVELQRPGEDAYAAFLRQNLVGMHATVVYRKEALVDLGGFDPNLDCCEDYDVYLRITEKGKVAVRNEIVADYRMHGTNMSSDTTKMLKGAQRVLEKQRARASTNLLWRQAWQAGQARWFTHYAGIQWRELRSSTKPWVPRTKAALLFYAARPLRSVRFLAGKVRRGTAHHLRRLDRRRVKAGHLRSWSLRSALAAGPERVSEQFGYDRGKPVDRRYIEQFLEQNRSDIAGRVLEIGDNAYTKQFGANGCHSEVFNRFADVEGTTYSGDLAGDHNLPVDHLDCIIFTQTLHLIYDMPLAVETLWRALRPGGILLITVPWISPIDKGDWGASWYWSLSPAALRRLLGLRFGEENLAVRSFGNALAASAFLYGLAEHEIPARHLDYHDPNCPVIVAARAKKAG